MQLEVCHGESKPGAHYGERVRDGLLKVSPPWPYFGLIADGQESSGQAPHPALRNSTTLTIPSVSCAQ